MWLTVLTINALGAAVLFFVYQHFSSYHLSEDFQISLSSTWAISGPDTCCYDTCRSWGLKCADERMHAHKKSITDASSYQAVLNGPKLMDNMSAIGFDVHDKFTGKAHVFPNTCFQPPQNMTWMRLCWCHPRGSQIDDESLTWFEAIHSVVPFSKSPTLWSLVLVNEGFVIWSFWAIFMMLAVACQKTAMVNWLSGCFTTILMPTICLELLRVNVQLGVHLRGHGGHVEMMNPTVVARAMAGVLLMIWTYASFYLAAYVRASRAELDREAYTPEDAFEDTEGTSLFSCLSIFMLQGCLMVFYLRSLTMEGIQISERHLRFFFIALLLQHSLRMQLVDDTTDTWDEIKDTFVDGPTHPDDNAASKDIRIKLLENFHWFLKGFIQMRRPPSFWASQAAQRESPKRLSIYLRCVLTFISNTVFTNILLITLPFFLMESEDGLDFTKDCLSVTFIVTLDNDVVRSQVLRFVANMSKVMAGVERGRSSFLEEGRGGREEAEARDSRGYKPLGLRERMQANV